MSIRRKISLLALLFVAGCGAQLDSPPIDMELVILDDADQPLSQREIVAFRPSPCLYIDVFKMPHDERIDRWGQSIVSATGSDGTVRFSFDAQPEFCGFPWGHLSTWIVAEQVRLRPGNYSVWIRFLDVPSHAYELFYQQVDQQENEQFVLIRPLDPPVTEPFTEVHVDWTVSPHEIMARAVFRHE